MLITKNYTELSLAFISQQGVLVTYVSENFHNRVLNQRMYSYFLAIIVCRIINCIIEINVAIHIHLQPDCGRNSFFSKPTFAVLPITACIPVILIQLCNQVHCATVFTAIHLLYKFIYFFRFNNIITIKKIIIKNNFHITVHNTYTVPAKSQTLTTYLENVLEIWKMVKHVFVQFEKNLMKKDVKDFGKRDYAGTVGEFKFEISNRKRVFYHIEKVSSR